MKKLKLILLLFIITELACQKCGFCETESVTYDQQGNKVTSSHATGELCGNEYLSRSYTENTTFLGKPAKTYVNISCK
ncbi:MAG: hypothetical protein WBB02_07740 [Saprospiraceae bacterium]